MERKSAVERRNIIWRRLVRVIAQLCVVTGYLALAVGALLGGWLLSATPHQLVPDPPTRQLLRLLLGSVSVLGVAAWLWKGHGWLVRRVQRRIRDYLVRGLK